MTAKIFDINEIALSKKQVRALHEMKAGRKRPKAKPRLKKEPYAQVTASWQIAAHKVDAAQVAIALRYIQSLERARGNYGAFKVSNARMDEWGVDKWCKMRALRRLAKAGLILLDAADHRNPRVTIIEVGT